jgi:hypothetical protein
MNTCKTCKYKGTAITKEGEDFNEVPTGYYVCDKIKHIGEQGASSELSTGYIAGVIDGSGYYAALITDDAFGCNQWIKRINK